MMMIFFSPFFALRLGYFSLMMIVEGENKNNTQWLRLNEGFEFERR